MGIKIKDLQFGETDAKNEIFQQVRYGSEVFQNAFQRPPRINLEELLQGARFFIQGQKGCGKTALLLHTQRTLEKLGAKTHVVLFKTGINEGERARLASGSGIEILLTRDPVNIEYDYTTNWLWFIYRNLLRLVDLNDVTSGVDIAKDLKKLVGVEKETRISTFSDLAISRVKGAAKAAINAGGFGVQISTEVDAIKTASDDRTPIEIIEIIEKYICQIKMNVRRRCLLFFDELELFWNRPDQRERDLFLIRDLLQSVARVNRIVGAQSASFVVYASVRSEVLEEVNRVGPEIVRDIDDFGVSVNWNIRAKADEQPILRIVEAKVNASEIEANEIPTENIWDNYFPKRFHNRDIREHLLDVSMFKPRNIITRLNLAKNFNPDATRLTVDSFQETNINFSRSVWREIEEELLGKYSANHVKNLKAILTGFKPRFTISDLEIRVERLGRVDPSEVGGFETSSQIIQACRDLYRVGAVGNSFTVRGRNGAELRDRWSFRDMGDPLINETFVVHESLRKVFQLPFGS